MFEIKIVDIHLKNKYEKKTILESIARAFCLEISITDKNTLEIKPFFSEHPSCEEYTPQETDASGAVWDEKIHSANKTKTVEGLWRTRRNSSQADDESEIPEPSSAFKEFMEFIRPLRNSGKIAQEDINRILKDFDISSIPGVAEKKDLIPSIIYAIKEFLGDRK